MPRTRGKGGHGSCSYCGRVHRKRRGQKDSCRGHTVRGKSTVVSETEEKKHRTGSPNKGIAQAKKRQRREEADTRNDIHRALTPKQRLWKVAVRQGVSRRETQRLQEATK